MTHLIISREYPPSTYPRGGIGTYVEHMARLLAEAGETVHVIAERWDGAPLAREVRCEGRLIVHRVHLGEPLLRRGDRQWSSARRLLEGLAESPFPAQAFSWQAALLAEALVEEAAIDVVEGQDYEAPLYYLQLRRAIGLGPVRQPPCVVHLHSPWEFVCHANRWGLASDYDVAIKRLEDRAIASADGWLCPSRYLAAQAEAHYGLRPGSVHVVPYPVGDTPFIARPPEVWEHGSICYVGRLEPRKGVLEWVEAAVKAAAARPGLRFEFIGADTSIDGDGRQSVRDALRAMVPERLTSNFAFLDAQPRQALWSRLGRAQLVVVPSRWENYPLTCVEAMASGLPVLASPHGGMAEMIEDGATGWLASSGSPADLARALERALGAPPARRAEMGRAAARAVRGLCDNTAIVRRSIEIRARLVDRGADRSARLAELPAWQPPIAVTPRAPYPSRRVSPDRAQATRSIGVILIDDEADDLAERLTSVRAQTRPAAFVMVVGTADRRAPGDREWTRFAPADADWFSQLRAAGTAPAGLTIAAPSVCLAPTYVETCLTAFVSHPGLGVVASWHEEADRRVVVRPSPALPYQWIFDDAGACVALRPEAVATLTDASRRPDEAAVNDLVLSVLVQGWGALTWPAPLYRRTRSNQPPVSSPAGRAAVRQALLARDSSAGGRDWPLLHALLQARSLADATGRSLPRHLGRGPLSPSTIRRLPLAEQFRLLVRAVRRPDYAWRWFLRHVDR